MLDWKHWVYGLISAAIGGGASAASVLIVSPETFNFHEGLLKLGEVFLISAIVSTLMYLKQSPLPAETAVLTKTETTTQTVTLTPTDSADTSSTSPTKGGVNNG